MNHIPWPTVAEPSRSVSTEKKHCAIHWLVCGLLLTAEKFLARERDHISRQSNQQVERNWSSTNERDAAGMYGEAMIHWTPGFEVAPIAGLSLS